MAVMISEVYDALREIGVSEDKARRAAEAVAVQEPRLTAIETKLTATEGRLGGIETRLSTVEGRLTRVETRLGVLQWMVAGLYAVLTVVGVPSVWLLLRVAAKVGALG